METPREFTTVETAGEQYLVQLRQERPTSLLGPNSPGKSVRTLRGRLRWFVEVESGSSLLPILREQFRSENEARRRVAEVCAGLSDGSIRPGRLPAVRWRRRSSGR